MPAPQRPLVVHLGDHVVIPTWVVAVLHTDPTSGLNDYRRAVRGRDRGLDEALRELCLIAAEHVQRRTTSTCGRTGAPPADIDASSSPQRLTTTQAATRLGLTARQVRRLVAEGQLSADRPGYGLLLSALEVEEFRARRAG